MDFIFSPEKVIFKKDIYQEVRGGTSTLLEISCSNCKHILFYYQKDGGGELKRCYLNRIIFPASFANLQHDQTIKECEDMPNLDCPQCKTCIGIPMRHSDERLAFSMHPGLFKEEIKQI
jgi:phage FluMu protein Com